MRTILLAACFALGAVSAEQPVEHGHGAKHVDAHAHHRALLADKKTYQRSVSFYEIPDVEVIEMNGNHVSLKAELDRNVPVILNFVFTSCSTVCPVLTATFAQAQEELAGQPVRPRLMSVSIDPEYDTPDRLRTYAKSFGAEPQWRFFTGDLADIVSVQQAFDAYRGDKLNHAPLTFLRAGVGRGWVRLEGFTTAANLVQEYRALLSEYPGG